MNHQAEELGKKRRQDEVAKARVMLEAVSEKERREMIAMFPELRQSKSAEQRLNYFDDADEDVLPKAYVFMGPELVRAPPCVDLAQRRPAEILSHSPARCSGSFSHMHSSFTGKDRLCIPFRIPHSAAILLPWGLFLIVCRWRRRSAEPTTILTLAWMAVRLLFVTLWVCDRLSPSPRCQRYRQTSQVPRALPQPASWLRPCLVL